MKNKLTTTEGRLIRCQMDKLNLTYDALVELLSEVGTRKDKSTIHKMINLNLGVSFGMREKLEEVLKLPSGTLVEALKFSKTPDAHSRQEIKNLVCDFSLSKRILSGENPSLFSVVDCTKMTIPFNRKRKLDASQSEFGYLHFFQPSCILRVKWPGESGRLLGYLRQPLSTLDQYCLTQGKSILWAASYDFRRSDLLLHPMDMWFKLQKENDSDASDEFLKGAKSILVKLLDKKLRLPPGELVFRPFGVATNQKAAGDLFYTQYVFEGTLILKEKPNIQRWSLLVPAVWVELRCQAETTCVDKNGDPLCLDTVILKALQSNAEMEQFRTARFIKNFTLS